MAAVRSDLKGLHAKVEFERKIAAGEIAMPDARADPTEQGR